MSSLTTAVSVSSGASAASTMTVSSSASVTSASASASAAAVMTTTTTATSLPTAVPVTGGGCGAIPIANQDLYAYYLVYFYVVIIFIYTCLHVWSRFLGNVSSMPQPKPTAWQKAMGLYRMICYKRPTGALGDFVTVPAGTVIGMVIVFIFVMAISLIDRPYYRQSFEFGPPPLANRTGVMTAALTPLIYGLAGKVNIVSFLTGYGHEKLNLFHRFASLMYLLIGVIHTIPFIVDALQDGGQAELMARFSNLRSQEFSGIWAMVCILFLCTFSGTWFRSRYYEAFVLPHIIMAMLFIPIFFWHTSVRRFSWPFIIATCVIIFIQMVLRGFLKVRANRKANVRLLEGPVVEVTIPNPGSTTWKPSQHVFLRFPAIGLLQNHPFGIASYFKPGSGVNEMVFLIKPLKGMTRRLLNRVSAHQPFDIPNQDVHRVFDGASDSGMSMDSGSTMEKQVGTQMKVWVDGPYGGHVHAFENHYEAVTLVAGGLGVTGVLARFEHLVHQMQPHNILRSVRLVWIVQQESSISWIADTLKRIASISTPVGEVHIDVYVTRGGPNMKEKMLEAEYNDVELEEDVSMTMMKSGVENVYYQRPDFWQVIPDVMVSTRNCFIVCGPPTLIQSVSNACAWAQAHVMLGTVQEVALHTESFGW